MNVVSAQYVLYPYKGLVTTDKWVGALMDDGTTKTILADSDLPEWQAYLAAGGTIEPYEDLTELPSIPVLEPSPPPPAPPQAGPVLERIDPVSMPSNSDAFEMMCWGDNFSFSSVVLLNGEKVQSVFLNHHQIMASLTGGTWRQVGTYKVRIVRPDPNLINDTTDEVPFTFTEATP